MQACTIIFKRILPLFTFLMLSLPVGAFAQNNTNSGAMIPSSGNTAGPPRAGDPNQAPAIPTGAKKEEPNLFDQSSPYLDYGDFNMNEEENEDSVYFQYGRFFGVSLGLGYQTATGNRGKLYESAFPRLDLRIEYWFSFNFAFEMGVDFVNQNFADPSGVPTSVKMVGYYGRLKYYLDIRDSSAALAFANPFLSAGVGAISKSESTSQTSTPSSDSTLSIDLGGGLEFPIVYRKTYFIIEGMYHTQNFADSNTVDFQPKGIDDLSGGFFTLSGHIMFVW